MAWVETRDLALQPARRARREGEAPLCEEPRELVAAEADDLATRERLRVEADCVERHPELESRQQAADGDGRLGEEVVEAPAPHAKGGGPKQGRGGKRTALHRPAAAGAAAALCLACATLAPRGIPHELLRPLVERAERARSLHLPAPIEAEWTPAGEVRALLAREIDAVFGPDDFARAEALEGSLGLLPGATPLRDALLDLQSKVVAGFYTPLAGRLYIVSDGPGEESFPENLESVAVHELVHALQHATSPLLDVLLGLEDHDDLGFALGALIEGDALWATLRDQAERSGVPPPRSDVMVRDVRLDDPQAPGSGAPRLLREPFLLQYPLGYAIADALAAAGGTAALDAALRDPPLSSEEILHPAAYLGAAPRTPIAWLALDAAALGLGGCRLAASNTFGELGLRIWLRERGASEPRAAGAAEGWDGDRAAVFECGAERALAWLVQLDAEVDAVELAALVASLPPSGFSVDRSGRRVLVARALAEPARRAALAVRERRFADLESYLGARPEVLERAATLRARTRERER